MRNKKWYIIGLVSIIVILSGVFLGLRQVKSNSMNGTYYEYYSNDKVGGEYFKEGDKIVIKGDVLTYIPDTIDSPTSWILDKKRKTMKYTNVAEYPYDYKDDVFSFNNLDLVKENSKTYKNSKEK
ncbi:hypothetical protein MASR1M48_08720 [Lactococcus petauri]|uniref:hypothetical protein n=1 Tax=Lactococcus sp. bn62 TaxID=3037457 RepID=UPI0024C4B433|nr:hypothetical protein [Lactococcus sp. bn62]WKY24148.1 hypothetical protein P3G65_10595 [Lactococcus sp. bn62]